MASKKGQSDIRSNGWLAGRCRKNLPGRLSWTGIGAEIWYRGRNETRWGQRNTDYYKRNNQYDNPSIKLLDCFWLIALNFWRTNDYRVQYGRVRHG